MDDPYIEPEAAAAAVLAITGAIILFSLLFGAVLYVLICLPLGALFKKAGIEPWKAWVPYYGTYVWLQLGGQNGWWVLATLIPGGSIVTAVFQYFSMWATGRAFRKDVGFLVLGILLPIVWLFILGFGKDRYEPELIKASGLTPPLVGYGAERPAAYPTYPAAPTA